MSNDLIIKWKKRCGSACILFLIAVLSPAFSSLAQDPESSKKLSPESTDSQKKNSDESESDSGEEASSDKDDGSGDNEQTPGSIDSTPVESEQNPASGENVAPAGPSPTVPAPPPSRHRPTVPAIHESILHPADRGCCRRLGNRCEVVPVERRDPG